MTSWAAFPTAYIAQAVKTKTVIDPKRPLKKTSIYIKSTTSSFTELTKFISSINAANNKKQAILALPTLYPLVLALVIFPTASKRSVIFLTLSYCIDISAIPPALSAIGPKPDIPKKLIFIFLKPSVK